MTSPTTTPGAPDTIVLIHGLWMTSRSWEHWVPYFEKQGYRVLTPTYPGLEVEVEALRADPSPIAALTIHKVVEHLEKFLDGLEKPPILMGHSFGGTLTQILLDHGYGAVGVAINSAPTEGVLIAPLSQAKSIFPVLKSPANRHEAVPFTPEQFHFAFTNVMNEEQSAAVYERYYIPTPGNIVWDGLLQNLQPGHQDAWVNYKNDDRAPLLFIAGDKDNIMPASVNKSNFGHYSGSKAVTEYHEFPGRCHFTCGQDGWEAVADYALNWAKSHSRAA